VHSQAAEEIAPETGRGATTDFTDDADKTAKRCEGRRLFRSLKSFYPLSEIRVIRGCLSDGADQIHRPSKPSPAATVSTAI
jgi:hypothetical protein